LRSFLWRFFLVMVRVNLLRFPTRVLVYVLPDTLLYFLLTTLLSVPSLQAL
jgi:hypothetical protein